MDSSNLLESSRKSGQSLRSTTFLEMDNLSRRGVEKASIYKSRSRSTEILSTLQVLPSDAMVATDGSSIEETKRPCTNDSSKVHVPDISSRQQRCSVLDALTVCEVSLANEVNRGGSALDACSKNNDDFRRARSLLKELKRTLHKLSSETT